METSSSPEPPPAEAFLRRLIRQQLQLSIACAFSFLLLLLGLPLLNYFRPDLMAIRIAGFTLTWLVLGILFFPFVWIISWLFIRRSIQLEREELARAKRDGLFPSETSNRPDNSLPE